MSGPQFNPPPANPPNPAQQGAGHADATRIVASPQYTGPGSYGSSAPGPPGPPPGYRPPARQSVPASSGPSQTGAPGAHFPAPGTPQAPPTPLNKRPGQSAPAVSGEPGDLNAELINSDIWNDAMVARAGIPIVDTAFLSIGGGIGSFVTVDYLRIYGVLPAEITVLTQLENPWSSYEYLTRVSQVPRKERLRSDSASSPDNIWGFPSYAVREAFSAKSISGFFSPLWNVLTEPIFRDYYTPKAGHAFESMEAESNRINYQQCVRKGQVRMVRRRAEGGYFTILTPPAGAAPTKRIAYRSQFVHVAIGYPGLKLLPDLQKFREEHRDPSKVVNAYEPHEHVYQQLMLRPGKVMLRGGGIVASRVLQRLIDDRDRLGLQTQIVHVFRTYVTGPHGPNIFKRRPGSHGWAYQGFNYPKSVWGGQLKAKVRNLEGEERAKAYKEMGGTNTPIRKNWQEQLRRGRAEGWYKSFSAKVENLRPGNGQGVITTLSTAQGTYEEYSDFVIDCTGLEADIRESRVLADLLDHSNVGRNPIGRLDVDKNFELIGTRSGPGRMYASGSSTLGGPFPGVDTFLGLQIAALEIADDLVSVGFAKRFGSLKSVSQWWKWARGKKI